MRASACVHRQGPNPHTRASSARSTGSTPRRGRPHLSVCDQRDEPLGAAVWPPAEALAPRVGRPAQRHVSGRAPQVNEPAGAVRQHAAALGVDLRAPGSSSGSSGVFCGRGVASVPVCCERATWGPQRQQGWCETEGVRGCIAVLGCCRFCLGSACVSLRQVTQALQAARAQLSPPCRRHCSQPAPPAAPAGRSARAPRAAEAPRGAR